jgi:3',5'-cyclic AMP phosphodiesterase CpdA
MHTDSSRIIFVSVPGTHHAAKNRFYYQFPEKFKDRRKIDFPLVKNADTADDKRFTIGFVTDTHTADYREAKEGTEKAYRAVMNMKPDLVIHGGDMVFDLLHVSQEDLARGQFNLYINQIAPIIKAPFYHTLGNHDVFGWMADPPPDPLPPLYGKEMYRKYFGPTYYSFNYKHCHFLVLDSVGRTVDDAGMPTYYGFIDDAQLEWVRKDLAQIDRETPVIVVSHIPTINALASLFAMKSEVVRAEDGERTPKHQARGFQRLLGEVLKGYNFRLALGGHFHTYEEIRWKDNRHDAYFVVGGSVCGEWWKGDRTIGYCRWAEGFTRIDVDGERFTFAYIPYGWVGTEEQVPHGATTIVK